MGSDYKHGESPGVEALRQRMIKIIRDRLEELLARETNPPLDLLAESIFETCGVTTKSVGQILDCVSTSIIASYAMGENPIDGIYAMLSLIRKG